MTTEPTLTETLTMCGLSGPSWQPWHCVAKVLSASPLTRDETALFETCTGRSRPPTEPPAEAWFICGRRSGKSRFSSALAIRAASRRYRLAPGEQAVVAMAAADKDQARVLFSYASAPFLTPVGKMWQALAALVTRSTRYEINLATDVTLGVHVSHFGRIRGRTFAQAHADEVAFWAREDGSNPASEVLAAIRPGLATLGGQLIVTTSPFAKAGPVWDTFSRYYAKDDARVLIWRAPTLTMNPTLPQSLVDDAMERDPESAKAEWLAEFRDDLSALVTDAALRACVVPGRTGDLDWNPEADYLAFTDVATGSGQDSFTLGIAHIEQEPIEANTDTVPGKLVVVIDLLREYKPPFNPEDVVKESSQIIRSFGGLDVVHGDRFAGGFTDASFLRYGIRYEPSPLSKSELYLAMLSLINSRHVELPDAPRLLNQLAGLQRRPGAAGRESVDHAARVGAHDDLANVAAGAAVLAYRMATSPQPRIVLV